MKRIVRAACGDWRNRLFGAAIFPGFMPRRRATPQPLLQLSRGGGTLHRFVHCAAAGTRCPTSRRRPTVDLDQVNITREAHPFTKEPRWPFGLIFPQRGAANALGTIFSLGWKRIARVALHRRRVLPEIACCHSEHRCISGPHSHSFRSEMARAHGARHQRSHAARDRRRKTDASRSDTADGGRHSRSREKCIGAVADIRCPDTSGEPKAAGSGAAPPAKSRQPACNAAHAPDGAPATAIRLVWRSHVVVTTIRPSPRRGIGRLISPQSALFWCPLSAADPTLAHSGLDDGLWPIADSLSSTMALNS